MIIRSEIVGPVEIVLKRYDCKMFGQGADEYRIFLKAAKSGNPLGFKGPYYKLSVANAQFTRTMKDPRWNK